MRTVHERICVVPANKSNVELGFVTQHEGDIDDPSEYLSIDLPPDTEPRGRRVILDWKADGRVHATERWLNVPLPRSRQVSLSQVSGLCVMVVRR